MPAHPALHGGACGRPLRLCAMLCPGGPATPLTKRERGGPATPSVEEFADLLRWAGEDGAGAAFDDGALDEFGVLGHGVEVASAHSRLPGRFLGGVPGAGSSRA